jgi:hypothetical protein
MYGGAETQPGYQPPAQQQVTYNPTPDRDYITARIPETPRFSMSGYSYTVVLALIVTGIILLLVARIIAVSMIKLDYDDTGTLENLTVVIGILSSIGLALIPIGLFYSALAMDDLDPPIRSGLAIAGGVIVGLTSFVTLM